MPGELFDRFGRPRVARGFTGRVYANISVAVDNSLRRFETEPCLLLYARIRYEVAGSRLGDGVTMLFCWPEGTVLDFYYIDLSRIYVRNLLPATNSTVSIVGIRL